MSSEKTGQNEMVTNVNITNEEKIGGPQWQEHCDICAESEEFYAQSPDFKLLRCRRCGLIWTNPLRYFVPKSIIGSRKTYWGEQVYQSQAATQKKRFRQQLKLFLQKTRLSDPKSLKILEVGCGLGIFLDVCQEYGIAAEGCDVAEKAVNFANREVQRVRLGTLDSSYPDNSFDAIFAFNLIEHLPHPKEFFQEAMRVTKPGGIIVIETPIQQSLFHRLARIGYILSKCRLIFWGMEPGGHIYKFSTKTFKFVGKNYGFNCLYQKNIDSPFGELWGKSSLVKIDNRGLYRFSLPLVWSIARLTGQGNRLLFFCKTIRLNCRRIRLLRQQKNPLSCLKRGNLLLKANMI